MMLLPTPLAVSSCHPAPLVSSSPISRKPLLSSSWRSRGGSGGGFCCSAANKPSPPPPPATEVSSAARIRSEVLSPFRSVRMFFYLAFIASGTLGGLIAFTQLIPALINPSGARDSAEILKGFGIDVAAVVLFAFLYSSENKDKNAQLARLAREENLSKLKLRLMENKIVPVSELRGVARLVIVAGPSEFIFESFNRSKPFMKDLLERGVLVVPFPTDGNLPTLQFYDNDDEVNEDNKKKRLWQLTPVFTSDWANWLGEQKRLANVSPDSPVYLSLRLDGRVRGSGVGYPPWQAFVAQLPPVTGIWSGVLDGMDGRVL